MDGFAFCARWLLGLLFASGAAERLLRPAPLRAALDRFGLFGEAGRRLAVVAIPLWEGALGALLLGGVLPRVVLGLAGLTWGVYAGIVWRRLALGEAGSECGCGGVLATGTVSGGLVARNGILAALALVVALTHWGPLPVAARLPAALTVIGLTASGWVWATAGRTLAPATAPTPTSD